MTPKHTTVDRAWRMIAEEGIAMARSAGWHSTLAGADQGAFKVEIGGRQLSFLHADVPDSFAARDRNVIRLSAPWDIAARAFAAATGSISGHLTILAPVGSYTSPLQTGCIDAVVLGQSVHHGPADSRWTRSCASIGHSRCWLMNVAVFEAGISDGVHLQKTLMSDDRLFVPPTWKGISDTATLSEHARDCGRSNARFHQIVVLAADFFDHPVGPRITAWLAFTDAIVSAAVANSIGAAVAPEFSPEQRSQQLGSALDADLRGWL